MKYRRCRCEIFAFNGKGKGSATHYNALCRLCRHLPREKSIQIAESKLLPLHSLLLATYYLLLFWWRTECKLFRINSGGYNRSVATLNSAFCILHSAFPCYLLLNLLATDYCLLTTKKGAVFLKLLFWVIQLKLKLCFDVGNEIFNLNSFLLHCITVTNCYAAVFS